MKTKEARVAASPSKATESDLAESLLLAVSPVHKAALGMATGLVAGLIVAALTLFVVVLRPEPTPRLDLLANYFYGYTVTPSGAAVGFAWAFAVGFVAGWFVAFVRNFTTAVWLFFVRTRAQFSRNFLDHI
jgi:fructose-specific phosphotransferase system IIC component